MLIGAEFLRSLWVLHHIFRSNKPRNGIERNSGHNHYGVTRYLLRSKDAFFAPLLAQLLWRSPPLLSLKHSAVGSTSERKLRIQ